MLPLWRLCKCINGAADSPRWTNGRSYLFVLVPFWISRIHVCSGQFSGSLFSPVVLTLRAKSFAHQSLLLFVVRSTHLCASRRHILIIWFIWRQRTKRMSRCWDTRRIFPRASLHEASFEGHSTFVHVHVCVYQKRWDSRLPRQRNSGTRWNVNWTQCSMCFMHTYVCEYITPAVHALRYHHASTVSHCTYDTCSIHTKSSRGNT